MGPPLPLQHGLVRPPSSHGLSGPSIIRPPRHYLRTHHEYAPCTAIIPSPLNTLHGGLLGGPQGRIWHHPVPSQAILQPLVLVAPPLILGPPQPPGIMGPPAHSPPPPGLREEDVLAHDRLASFFNEETPPHKPRSLLSYPDSHLYESLISQMSEMAAEEVSLSDSKQENDSKTTINSSKTDYEDNESDKPEENNTERKKEHNETKKESKEICNTCKKFKSIKKNDKIIKKIDEKPNTPVSHSDTNEADPRVDDIAKYLVRIAKTIAFSSDDLTNLSKKDSQSSKEAESSFKLTAYQRFKALLKSKLRPAQDIYEEITPTPTAVSVVHINKDSGEDEVTVRASVCYKCDGTLRRTKYIDDNNYLVSSRTPHEKNCMVELKKSNQASRQGRHASRDSIVETPPFVYQGQTPIIPKTRELPEMGPNATLGKNSNKSSSLKTDKATQVNPKNLASKTVQLDSSTLDPLRPLGNKNAPKMVRRNHTFSSKNTRDVGVGSFDSGIKTPKIIQSKSSCEKLISKRSYDKDVQQIIIDFDSESSCFDEDFDDDYAKRSWDIKEDSSSIYSSLYDDLNSLVLVYDASKNGDKLLIPSKYKETTPITVPRGGSSGLGSSGSYSSFEDLPSSGLGSSSVSFIEPSFCSSTLTVGSRGSLRFDYSRSWDHLNERFHPLRRPITSASQLKRNRSTLISIKKSLPWSSKDSRNAMKT